MNVTGPLTVIIAADSTANGLLAGRVYPGVVKQEAGYPSVAINEIDVMPSNTKTNPSDLDIALVQLDVYASTFSSAAAAAEAIRGAIDYYSGAVSLTGGGTVTVQSISYQGERAMFAGSPELYRRLVEYKIALRR